MNRRTLLLGWGGPALAAASLPPGACDCHTHIFGDPRRFPFSVTRSYTPQPALPAAMLALHDRLGIERVVIVTPSVYGSDNAATLWGMAELGKKRARGVAVIDEGTSEAELDRMDKAGIRGIRLNLATAGISDPMQGRERFRRATELMRRRGWHIQIYASLSVVSGIRDLVAASPVPVVFDHFGGAKAAQGTKQSGFAALLDMVSSGKAYVKISGAYRASDQAPDYGDAAPLARALIGANADRIVWGTDWPHPDSPGPAGRKPTEVSAPLPIDDARLLGQLAVWAPDAAVRRKILAENPARLYGF